MKERKKIAVVCNYGLTPNRVGGMDRFFWLFDKKCKENGHEIVWFFPNIEKHSGYQQLTIIAPDTPMSLETFVISYAAKEQVKFDVVITHFLELCSSFFKEIKRQHPSKTIAVDHNPRPLEGFPFKKKLQKKIKGLLYSRYTDLFVGVSEYTVHHILKDYGTFLKRKTKRVYNGIATDLFKINKDRKHKEPRFVVTSNLRYIKGIQDLVDAVALLPDVIRKDITIDLYGEGDYEATLRSKIANAGLTDNFIFKGSSPDLNVLYANYDYMIQPTYMECFSLSILESLAANVPVITTPVGGNLEVIQDGENGYVFEAKDSKKLSSILEKLYAGAIFIAKPTYPLIEKEFTLEKMVQHHMDLL